MDIFVDKYFNTNEVALLYQGKMSVIEESINADKESIRKTNDLFKLAIIYLYMENSTKFFKTIDSIIERMPNNFDAIFLFVQGSFIFQKDSVSYLKYLSILLKESSNNAEVYALCAQVYYKVDNLVKAKECAEAALSNEPENYAALYIMSMCSLKDRQIAESKNYLSKAVEKQSESDKLFQVITPDQIDSTNLAFSKQLFKKGVQLNKHNKSLNFLYKLSYFKNNLFYKPLLAIENFNLDNKYFWIVLGIIIMLIPFMFFFSNFTILFMEVLKWFSTIIMLIYIPYQLVVYILLSLMYPYSVKT